jgi:hypothetical protein
METWVIVLLGIIAFSSLVQIGFLASVAVLGLRAARRAGELQAQARAELQEPLRHITETTRHVRDISSMVSSEVRTLRDSAHAAKDEVAAARDHVTRVVRSPWVEVSAFAKGVTRAASVFRGYA